jgi:Domain of unknown function (DUF4397)
MRRKFMKNLWTHVFKSALVLCVMMGAAPMNAAHAQDSGTTSRVRVLHALSLGQKVDVYIDGWKIFNDTEFGNTTKYERLPAGYHHFQIKTNNPTRTIASTAWTLRPGNYYTLGIYGTPRRLRLLTANDSTGYPAYASARLTAYHLSPGLPAFDVVGFVRGGRILSLIRNVRYGQAKSANIPAIPMTVRLVRNGHILKTLTGVRPLAGRRYAAYALGRPSRNFKLLLDPTGSP